MCAVYINTHACMHIFLKNLVYILNIYIYIYIYNRNYRNINTEIFSKYMRVYLFLHNKYAHTHYVNKSLFWLQLITV